MTCKERIGTGKSKNGFRSGRSTHDSTFVLMTMIERAHKTRNAKLNIAFVDLRKAFD